MSRHKLKPNFDAGKNIYEQINKVSEFFGDAYDDREDWDPGHVTLTETAKAFNTTILRVRKMLITAEKYSIAQSREVQRYAADNLNISEIMQKTGLSRSSVHSYLPYSKGVYKLAEKSVGADRIERWRKHHKGRKDDQD